MKKPGETIYLDNANECQMPYLVMQQLLTGFRFAGLIGPVLALMFLLDLSTDLISKILFTIAFILAAISVKTRVALVPCLLFLLFAVLIGSGFTVPALYYPVLMSFIVFVLFFSSLFQSKCLIQKIALKMEPELPEYAMNYCYVVNIIWTIFLALNTFVSYLSTGDLQFWSWYNGLISYLLIALLFISEYIFRSFYRRSKEFA